MNPTIKARIIPAQHHSHGEHGVSVTLKSGQVNHFRTEDIAHVTFHADHDDVDVEMERPEIVAEEPGEHDAGEITIRD